LLQGEPPAPPPSRLEQIREIARNDPDAYDANKELQGERLALTEAAMPAAPSPTSGADNAVD
jgi:hypothetical protein